MLTKLLEIRNIVIDTYRKVRFFVNPVIKFIIALLVFSNINSAIGFNPDFAKTSIVLVMSLVSAVTPGGVMVFLAMVLALLHVYYASLFLSVIVLMIFIVLYAALMRFSNGNAIVAVLVPLLAPLNLHFAVPMVLGCVATPVSVLPCACGVVFYYLIDIIKTVSGKVIEEINLDEIITYYKDILDVIIGQKEMYIVIIVFALVIIVVFLLRRLPFDYSFLISVGVGAAVNIIGLLVGSLKFDLSISVGSIIFMSIICAVITMASDFMKRVLDYTAIEHVQFEDDDFYYYVKAVPKIKISMTNHNIRVLSPGDDDVSEGEAYPDDEDYVSAYSEQAPGYDLYSDYDDEHEPEPEEENLAMQYAMSDVEGDYEADYEEDMTDETDFDETGYDEAGYDDSGYTETGYDDSDYDRN
ncbi:MAG: hypothetical protein IKR54_03455 [Lachnospiraceae bacterium]|nr:hypothetical protein [Lachnospiraceae bacterium]